MDARKTICFYLDNSTITNADLTDIEAGNPGIGGTQYYCAALPFYIDKFLKSYKVVLYAHHIEKLPGNITLKKIETIFDAYKDAIDNSYNFFVFRPLFSQPYMHMYTFCRQNSLKLIAWAHNMLTSDEYAYLFNCKKLTSFLCVSREQYDKLIDHSIFQIAHYIENPFNLNGFFPSPAHKKENVVTYIGSIVPSKGFHRVAKMWPFILKRVPDAKLMVIGSGGLYNENTSLGKWGIADEVYERKFRKFLSAPDGFPIESVVFFGKMGLDKVNVLQLTKVGIPNPTGRTENCPGSVLEFASCAIPVVTARRNGMIDTVIHQKTGYLSNNLSKQVDYVVELLQNSNKCAVLGQNARDFVSEKFNPAQIIEKWALMLKQIEDSVNFQEQAPLRENLTLMKKVRVFNKAIKKYMPFVPPIQFYQERIIRLVKLMLNFQRMTSK